MILSSHWKNLQTNTQLDIAKCMSLINLAVHFVTSVDAKISGFTEIFLHSDPICLLEQTGCGEQLSMLSRDGKLVILSSNCKKARLGQLRCLVTSAAHAVCEMSVISLRHFHSALI